MKSINLKNSGTGESSASNIALLLEQFENLDAIDVSDNGALGTSGAARLLEGLGRGVKSVSLKGTGLGLAAGQVWLQQGQKPVLCSDEDWARLEGALRGLSVLEAIDVSDNRALGTSGVGRVVMCCAGEALVFVITLMFYFCPFLTLFCRELGAAASSRQHEVFAC